MEDILKVYQRPTDDVRPLVCFELHEQIVDWDDRGGREMHLLG